MVSKWYHPVMAMTLRTDSELETALSELAEAEGTSKQEAIRRAVIEKRDRVLHRARVDAIASDLLVEYADALDRLGKA
jgi:predicted transcriptional regulator